jgi:hypothetical protein
MKETLVTVHKVPDHLRDVIKVDDVGIVVAALYEENTVIVREQRKLNTDTGMWETVTPATIAPRGSYKSSYLDINGQKWGSDHFQRPWEEYLTKD